MELGIKDKTRVSKALEEKVFDGALKKRELEALYRRCTSYQTEAPEPWSGDLYRPYSKYFGFLSSLKVRACLNELSHYGYLDRWKKKSIEVFDFGAGTLGASLGVVDFATATKLSIEKLTTIDVDLKPMQWAAKYFEDFLEPSPEFKTSLSSPSRDKASLLVAVDVLNEQDAFRNRSFDDPSMKFLKDWISEMNEDSIFLWIEPANKKTNQNFLAWRDHLKNLAPILLPCTHQANCPALEQREWCHEDRDYLAPSVYWNLVHDLGFHRDVLSFSFLALGKQKSPFGPQSARVVSRDLQNKGRCDKWLCANGKRWKAGLLKRHEGPENASYFESRRGDIVDCASTGLKTPD
jgi:hypothetical protein